MRVVVQRVARAAVRVENEITGEIGAGLVLLIGVTHEDTRADIAYVMDKCVHLRIFNDDTGKMNRSVLEIGGEILAISQFTVYGDTRKGRRPGYDRAARPEIAQPLYDEAVNRLRTHRLRVETGVFGAYMQVDLVNDGPVTLIVESK